MNSISTKTINQKEEIILQLIEIEKSYKTYSETLHVLRGVDLTINRGEIVSIMGPSGSGKSTLLNIIGLLDTYDSGTYSIAGIDTSDLSRKQKQLIRLQKIGFVFQTFNLIQTLTVQQNIELPMNLLRESQEAQHKRSSELMSEFGLTTKKKKFPYQLSIGEQQRVSIARALVNNPVIILCDEPTGNLDEENAQTILDHLSNLKRFNTTILIVTHNPSIKQITDRNFILSHGKIELQT
ncbi:ABC transporter ATP-binding protein [Candidatus Harpocratesius sp.]